MEKSILAPSMLAANHSRLAEEVHSIETLGAQWLHIDIMDGHFVPNLTFGPQTVADLRSKTKLFFDVHLMLDNPQEHLEAFIEAGAEQVSIHVEPSYDIGMALKRIRSLGAKCGIALNPKTPIDEIVPFLESVNLVLAMTVQPGFGGQSFDRSVLKKLTLIDGYRQERGLRFRLEVDGGVDLATAPLCREAKADTFVAGTAFFKAEDRAGFRKRIESL